MTIAIFITIPSIILIFRIFSEEVFQNRVKMWSFLLAAIFRTQDGQHDGLL